MTFKEVDYWNQVESGTTIIIDMTMPRIGDKSDRLHDQITVSLTSPYLDLTAGPWMILGEVDNLALLNSKGETIDLITIGEERAYWQLAAAFAHLPNQFLDAPDP